MFTRATALVFIYALGMLAPPRLAAGPDRHVVPLLRIDDVSRAHSAAGDVKIELRDLRVEMTGPQGTPAPYTIFLLFEPQSGAFSWTISLGNSATDVSEQTNWFKRSRAAYLKNDRIVTFTATMQKLHIQDFQGHASSMNDAEQKALSVAAALNDPPGYAEFAQPFHNVTLEGLSDDFQCEPHRPVCGLDPKVIDVQWDRVEQHWIVTLKARWTEEIALDADYNVVSMRKVE
jgi:hypothetical protein